MKKVIAITLVMLFILSIFVTGCTLPPVASNNPQPTTAAQSTPEPTKAETVKPVTLNITWWGSQTRHDYTAKLLEMYTQKVPNVKFEATPAGWDGYFDKMAAQAAGGSMPDIVQMDYLYIANYTKNNALVDLTPFVSDKTLDLSDVDQTMSNTGIINGKLTGAVLSSTAFTLAINPEVFSKAGVALPSANWKWSDFEQAMLTIKEKTGAFGMAANLQSDTNILSYWVRQYGKTLYDPDGTKLGYDDDQIFIDYINMVNRLTKAKAIPSPDEWMQIASMGKEAQPVVTGEGGSTFEWANFPVIVEKTNPNIMTVIPPYADNGTKALWIKPGMFFSVAQTSKYQKEAAAFISWFINDIEANKVINTERGIPVASKVREALKANLTPKQKGMFEYMDVAVQHSAKTDPAEPAGGGEVSKAMADQMSLVLYDKATPEQAAADFRAKANEILARNAAK
jgi:multiple sugar transport system substrate-binding protein